MITPDNNFNNFNNFNQYNQYNIGYGKRPLTPEEQAEKKNLFIDCVKLGCMLLLYNILNTVFAYAFYYCTYYVKTKSFSLDYNVIFSYLGKEQAKLVSSTAYRMSANISITIFSLITMLLVAKFIFRVHISNFLKPNKASVKQGAIWAPACFVINMILSLMVSYFTAFMSAQGVSVPSSDFSLSSPSAISVIMQVSYVIILAPIIEEFIYRGLILGILSRYGTTAAVLLSALSFGLMHGNIPQAASAFATGIVYATIAINCGSIVPTIMIHAFNNLIANFSDISSALNIPHADLIFCLFEIAVALIGFFVLFSRYDFLKTKEPDSHLSKKQVTKSVFTNPAIIIYLLTLVYSIVKGLIDAN